MESLIQIVNKLQDAFAHLGQGSPLDLPQIAVVGGQSAGKSSVLENFVGKDFLPRGSGIVTRRPLILQLNNVSPGNSEYGEFLHCRGKKFTDFTKIRAEIEAETARTTGDRGVSADPINLRVFSPNVLNLTLIDLPGMTKVPVGDQPGNIEELIHNMIHGFIAKDNCIILAVTPANQDLANSDALKLTREVDPQGLRTIGVITKLDLMDSGTDACDVLENRLLPLRRGYIGVVNRSQQDINGNKNILAALQAETKFFAEHPKYKHLASRMGTAYLQQVLSQQLVNHIRETLPVLEAKLAKELRSLEKEVGDNGNDNSNPVKALVMCTSELAENFSERVDGGACKNISLQELSGGARIARIFHERLPFELRKVETDERTLRKEISIAIQNIRGVRSGLFTPDQAFEAVTENMIDRLAEPCLRVVNLVAEEVLAIVQDVLSKYARYPKFQEGVGHAVQLHLRGCEARCREFLAQVVGNEKAYRNTNHPDFVGLAAGSPASEQRTASSLSNQIIRKGWLLISQPGMVAGLRAKQYWFVLTAETLTWFKDDDEKETRMLLPLEALKLQVVEDTGLVKRRNTLALFYPDGRNVHKDMKTLDLTATSLEDMEAWQASFLRAGVFTIKPLEPDETPLPSNSALERQVETIRNLVASYMSIVSKTLCDQVPKMIMNLIVGATQKYLTRELLASMYCRSPEELMEESQQEVERRAQQLNMFTACKEALKIIGEITLGTRSEPLPPAPKIVATAKPARPAPVPKPPAQKPVPPRPVRPQ